MERAWVHETTGWHESDAAAAIARLTGRRGPAVWLEVEDLAEVVDAARRLKVPADVQRRLARVDVAGRGRRAHVERLPQGGKFLVVPTLRYLPESRDVITGRIACVITGDLAITAEEGEAGITEAAQERLTSGDPLPEDGAHQVLAAMLVAVVAAAGDVENGIGESVADTEQVVFSPADDDPVQQVYALKREIAEARRGLVPLSSQFTDLGTDQEEDGDGHGTRHWLQRLETTVDRIDHRLDAHDELLADMLSVHLSQVSVRQNEDMRKISAWAAIIAVPTLIAGVYGMNFDHMPELSWVIGYPLSLGLMGSVSWYLYRLFKRSGWL